MRRRDLIVGVAGAAGLASVSRAAGVRSLIGVLVLNAGVNEGSPSDKAFIEGLRELGYVAGQNLEIVYRFAHDDYARLKATAEELAATNPDVVLAGQPSSARAMQQAAPSMPIVCPILLQNMPDLYANYARPGGSVTGIVNIVEGMTAKLLELATVLIPGIKRVGLLVNPSNANYDESMAQITGAARARGLALTIETATVAEEIAPALDRLATRGLEPVVVPANGFLIQNARVIAERAVADRLPTVFQNPRAIAAGGLLSYSVDQTASFRRAAYFIDKLLKGAKPADLPIEFPTKLVLTINLKTARAIGVTVPPILIATADDVIE